MRNDCTHASEIEIMLVEDSSDDIELTMHALQEENVANRVRVVRDGEAALDYFSQHAGDPGSMPHLVLLDLKLPKLSGLEVLKALKEDPRTRAIPVVMLTASREESDLMNSYALGVNSYVQKPVEFEQFRQIVRRLGFYWLMINEPPPGDGPVA